MLVTAISILIAIGATYVTLRFSEGIYRVLGRRGSLIVTRVFAVFIAAIAVQYIVQGVKELLHDLLLQVADDKENAMLSKVN